ncbi:unnamed protein product [Alopecurus aequalis]
MAHCRATIPRLSAVAMLAIVLLAVASEAAPPAQGKPGCETMCGNVSVPYPFGIGPARCSATAGFRLTCNHSTTPSRLILGDDGLLEVKEISLQNRTVRVVGPPILSDAMYNTTAGKTNLHSRLGRRGTGADHWEYSFADGSEILVTGCNIEGTLRTTSPGGTDFVSGCTSKCSGGHVITAQNVRAYKGGFCVLTVTSASTYLASYSLQLKRVGNGTEAANADLPVHAVIAEAGWFQPMRAAEIMNMEMPAGERHFMANSYMQIPLILNWICHNSASCNTSVSANSKCSAGLVDHFFSCDCSPGYEGNPYITHGCQDIDECERPEDHGCFGECRNTNGSFQCSCPRGFHGDPMQPNGCVKSVKYIGLTIGLSVATGPCIILLLLSGFFIMRMFKHRRAETLKRQFFNKNRGQLLQQLVSHRSDIAERMIIPLKELEKATNNFDEIRKLGGGGHGTVYKGILSDLQVVAIKKSNIMVQKEIDEFINEVAILSQINHRNIVKLLGCCLETEVPLVAYEFISNGTLDDHLHRESPRSIPWRDRLRIASEVSKAIAYLHYAVSSSIIHRDIKSSNILLDGAFTAKVSDFGASRYIPIDQTGITGTAVQGTIGYLDPMYYYTGRLSEMSDVYSFGVLLVELLTRKMPVRYRSSEGDGLVVQFVALLTDGNLINILDPQVVEEGGNKVQEVVSLAASCVKLRGEERPTMRQVEMVLEALQERVLKLDKDEDQTIAVCNPSDSAATKSEDVSRCYSLEEEFLLSARYPR